MVWQESFVEMSCRGVRTAAQRCSRNLTASLPSSMLRRQHCSLHKEGRRVLVFGLRAQREYEQVPGPGRPRRAEKLRARIASRNHALSLPGLATSSSAIGQHPVVVSEIGFLERDGKDEADSLPTTGRDDVGRIDHVLVHPDERYIEVVRARNSGGILFRPGDEQRL